MAMSASALQDSAVSTVTFRRMFVAPTLVRMVQLAWYSRQTSSVSVHLVMEANFAK